MKNKLLKLLLAALLAVASFTCIGCETTQGVGEDIEQAGEEIDEEF